MALHKGNDKTDEIKYEVLEELGVLSEHKGYVKKVRYMSWNGKEPRYDIRPWKQNEDGTETPTKPSGYTGEELEALYNILKGIIEN